MINGIPFKKANLQNSYDTIIIGSGISALTLGSILAQEGESVLLLERHYTAGGFTHSFSRKDYEWDVGLHYVGDVHEGSSCRKQFDYISKGEIKWNSMPEVYDEIILGKESFPYRKGAENLKSDLIQKFSEEKEAIEKYFYHIFKAQKSGEIYFGQKLLPRPLAQIIKPLCKSFFFYANQTTLEFLEKYITKNKKLIATLTGQWGDYGLPPAKASFSIHAMVTRHFFEGGYYPVGGAGQIAASIIPIIQKSKGEVVTHAHVTEVLIENNKAYGVKVNHTHEIHAQKIVTSIGVDLTQKLLGLKAQKEIPASTGHLSIHVGLKHDLKDLGIPGSNLWIYPNENSDQNVEAFLKDQNSPLPIVYVSFPSSKDPIWQKERPGTSTMELITLAPYCWFEAWENKPWKRRGEDYSDLKESFAKRCFEVLFEHYPQLKDKIDYYEVSTPLSTKKFCFYEHGEIYGLDHIPKRFDWAYDITPKTSIQNFYQTGQDTLSVGIAGALASGYISAMAMLPWKKKLELSKYLS